MGGTNTLGRFAIAYIAGRLARRELAADSAHRHRRMLLRFAASYGRRPLANMARADIERWLGTRSHCSAGTMRLELSVVRCFVRSLVIDGHLAKDPTLGVRSPKVPRTVPRALSTDEIAAVEAVLPDLRARAIFALMYGLGMRRCEVLSIEVGDWDRHRREITIRHGKGGHQRILPVTDDIAAVLAAYTRSHRAGPLIRRLDGPEAIGDSHLGKMVRAWMEAAGIKDAPFDGRAAHSFRHTAASELADEATDLRVVQEWLGHAHLTSTQIYLRRTAASRLREVAERRSDTRRIA